MWKAALVGVVALASIGCASVPASAQEGGAGVTITTSHIGQLKSMLRLTPAQERYWPAVESALRSLVRQSADEDASGGFVHRVKARAATIASNAAALRRVLSAARPLIRTLDEDQKRDAMALARSLGIRHLVAAL